MSESDSEGRRDEILAMLPDMLADFLTTDVRIDPERCDELLAGLGRARRGEAFAAYGNLYQLTADREAAVIRNAFDAGIGETRLSLEAMIGILQAWRAAIG